MNNANIALRFVSDKRYCIARYKSQISGDINRVMSPRPVKSCTFYISPQETAQR